MKKNKHIKFDPDKWLKEHLEELVNKYAGEYIVVADGVIYRGERPSRLRDKVLAEHPNSRILGMRVPYPQDFICALAIL